MVLGVSNGAEPASVYAERTLGMLTALKRLYQSKHASALGTGSGQRSVWGFQNVVRCGLLRLAH
jgi:hypothetical protein